jgi:hypothetical protein
MKMFLPMLRRLTAISVASLNPIRRKGKANVNIAEIEEEEESPE